jgi:hypothetical protein
MSTVRSLLSDPAPVPALLEGALLQGALSAGDMPSTEPPGGPSPPIGSVRPPDLLGHPGTVSG